jgi:hypothetical protein
MDGPFGDWFPGDTWSSWRAILKAAYALPMTDGELDFLMPVNDLFLAGRSIAAAGCPNIRARLGHAVQPGKGSGKERSTGGDAVKS